MTVLSIRGGEVTTRDPQTIRDEWEGVCKRAKAAEWPTELVTEMMSLRGEHRASCRERGIVDLESWPFTPANIAEVMEAVIRHQEGESDG